MKALTIISILWLFVQGNLSVDTTIEEYPFVVGVETCSSAAIPCGEYYGMGVILSEKYVLATNWSLGWSQGADICVRAGATVLFKDGQFVRIGPFHQDGNYWPLIFELEQPLTFSDSVQPVQLPNEDDYPVLPVGTTGDLIQWDQFTVPSIALQKYQADIIDLQRCTPNTVPWSYNDKTSFCTTRNVLNETFDMMSSPWMHDGKLYGIDFGYSYVRFYGEVRKWIRDVTGV